MGVKKQTATNQEWKRYSTNSIMTKISIIKSSSGIDNKQLFPLSASSSQKVWISSDSETEEEESIDTDNLKSIDSDMLEILIFSVCKL